jgi:hypothetical protein
VIAKQTETESRESYKQSRNMFFRIRHPYVWLCCGFAALGACLYGYEGVYFTGVSTLGMLIFSICLKLN